MKKLIYLIIIVCVLVVPVYGQGSASDVLTGGGILTLVLSSIGIWFRDWQKSKTFKAKNGQIESIQATVLNIDGKMTVLDSKHDKLDKKVSIIGTEVNNLSANLDKETKRHDKDLDKHSEQILQLAKNGKK